MSNVEQLLQRMDAEFSKVEASQKAFHAEQLREYEGRCQRMEQLERVFAQLRDIWKPRLEALAKKFGDKVQVTPHHTPSAKDAVFAFQSNLAKIELKFAASTDEDVRKLFLTYDLDILPILMRFDSHAEKEFPLDQVDLAATAEWIDDRIVSFVQTYLALHQNQLYLKDVMVSDPIAGVRFPKFAAATTLVHKGTTHYFIGEETLQAFREREGLSGS